MVQLLSESLKCPVSDKPDSPPRKLLQKQRSVLSQQEYLWFSIVLNFLVSLLRLNFIWGTGLNGGFVVRIEGAGMSSAVP